MKIAYTITRLLFGLIYALAAIVALFNLAPQPELEGDVLRFMEGMMAAVYLFPLIKLVELITGIAFLCGRFVPLATVVIFPVSLNILLFHLFVEPDGLLLAIILFAANLFLAWCCRQHYTELLKARTVLPS